MLLTYKFILKCVISNTKLTTPFYNDYFNLTCFIRKLQSSIANGIMLISIEAFCRFLNAVT